MLVLVFGQTTLTGFLDGTKPPELWKSSALDTFSLASSTLTLLEETLDPDELPAAAGGNHYNF